MDNTNMSRRHVLRNLKIKIIVLKIMHSTLLNFLKSIFCCCLYKVSNFGFLKSIFNGGIFNGGSLLNMDHSHSEKEKRVHIKDYYTKTLSREQLTSFTFKRSKKICISWFHFRKK